MAQPGTVLPTFLSEVCFSKQNSEGEAVDKNFTNFNLTESPRRWNDSLTNLNISIGKFWCYPCLFFDIVDLVCSWGCILSMWMSY